MGAMTANDPTGPEGQDEARRAIYDSFIDGQLTADEATARLLALDVRYRQSRNTARILNFGKLSQSLFAA